VRAMQPIAKIEGPTLSFRASKLLPLILMMALGGCAHKRPSMEYVLAREAFMAAREGESARYAPGYYHKAEESYRRGVQAYNEQSYDEAVEEFESARIFAEKAENAAHIQRQKTGDEAL
jgi:hypothetical protein